MVCAKCKRETDRGDIHYFFYGKKGATDVIRSDALSRTYRTQYLISGGKEAFICPRCAAIGFLSTWQGLLTIAATLILIYLIFYEMGPITWENVGIMALVYLIVVGFSWLNFRGNRGPYAFKAFGDLAAISVYRKELEKEGYDSFVTRADAARLGLDIPQDVRITTEKAEVKPVSIEEEVCWYCGTRPSLEEAAVIYKLKKEDKEREIEAPRCEYCMKTHDKVGVRSVVIFSLIFLLGTAACLVSGIAYDNWWMGVGISLVLFFVAGGLIVWMTSSTHKKAGLRNHGDALNQLPEIITLKKSGWKHTQTISKKQYKK
jgi:hypothetical protein